MLRIIQFFSERRPELLLSVTKGFLCKLAERNNEQLMCGNALGKYVIEKWKNIKDVL